MSEFKKYKRKESAELRPYIGGESMEGISISTPDTNDGSPKKGDMIARNPKNHADQWLVAREYFDDNFNARTCKCGQCKWASERTALSRVDVYGDGDFDFVNDVQTIAYGPIFCAECLDPMPIDSQEA